MPPSNPPTGRSTASIAPMRDTTEESDWQAYGPGRRSPSEPPLPGPELPSVPLLTREPVFPVERGPPPLAHPEGPSTQKVAILVASEHAREKPPGDAPAPSAAVVPAASTVPPTLPFNASPPMDQNASSYKSAEEENFSPMVAIGELDATPSQIAFMAQEGGRGSRGVPGSRSGRGSRGGRAGRPPKIKIEPPQEDTDGTVAPLRKVNKGGRPRGSRAGQSSASSTRGVNRGGRPRGSRAGFSASTGRGVNGRSGTGVKRKRKSRGDDEDEDGDTDSSEEITALPTQSRSGRHITQVITPVPIEAESTLQPPSMKRSSLATPSDPTSSSTKKPAKRKRVALSAVCKNCGRGHSPQGNQIVFCDGCNTPWHQYCHDRPITPTVIQEEEKEWHCADCETQAEEAGYLTGRIPPTEGMGLAEKRRALEAMQREELIALLLRASTLHPDLPILKPREAVTWTAAAAAATTTPQGALAKGEAQAEYEYYDEPLPYPRAGNGVRLPPEEDDVEFLIDDDVVTYSHSYVENGAWTGAMGDSRAAAAGIPAATGVAVAVGA